MTYVVADSYKDAQWIGEPYENEKGKMVVKIKGPCPRCGGTGHYSYNSLDGTRCYGCMGSGIKVMTVRAYTEKEKAAMDRAAARRVERKVEEHNAKVQANIDQKAELMQQFYAKNGFNEEGVTYVALGNTYDIKDQLKEAGYKFNGELGWHGPDPAGFDAIPFSFEDIYFWNDETAKAFFLPGVEEIIAEKKKSAEKITSDGDFIGEVKERLRNLRVVLKSRYSSQSIYGFSECLNFDDEDGNHFCWWTGTCPDIKEGEIITLTGTVKEHKSYNGKNITVLTRCKIG